MCAHAFAADMLYVRKCKRLLLSLWVCQIAGVQTLAEENNVLLKTPRTY